MENSDRQAIIVVSCVIIFLIFSGIINRSYDNKNNTQTEAKQEVLKRPFDGNLTTTQIDKICMTSLSEVNANPMSNYIKVSSNASAKKYVYQSKETLYKYTCGFTGNDTFYVNGEGWQDIIPRGTLYKGNTENCVNFDLYDPAFKLTHDFTVCN